MPLVYQWIIWICTTSIALMLFFKNTQILRGCWRRMSSPRIPAAFGLWIQIYILTGVILGIGLLTGLGHVEGFFVSQLIDSSAILLISAFCYGFALWFIKPNLKIVQELPPSSSAAL